MAVVTIMQESELIDRWQRGDDAAFEELVRRWQNRIGRFVAHYAGQSDVVEDLCQEVFLRVYRNAKRYRSTGAFSTWLYRIALNVARDHARRQKRRSHRSLNNHEPAGSQLTGDEIYRRKEDHELVAEALARLPEALRIVVLLRHYEKMSFAEISRVLRVPQSTLKSRFSLALKQLRTHLLDQGWSMEDEDT